MTEPKTWAEMSTDERAAFALGKVSATATHDGPCFECGGPIVGYETAIRLTSGVGASGELHLQRVHDRCP